jgi:hypothetical protein
MSSVSSASSALACVHLGRSRLELVPRSPFIVTESASSVTESANSWEDRRGSVRRTISELSWLGQVRLKYGPKVSLIDLSAGGVQIETAGHRLQPGGTVVVEIAAGMETFCIPSLVLRAFVSRISPTATYRSRLSFRRPFDFPVTAVNQMDALLRRSARAAAVNLAPDPPPSWKPLVVRYLDGRLLKGYSTDFSPAEGHVRMLIPNGPEAFRITVPLSHLKALFFVHDLDGEPVHLVRDGQQASSSEHGFRVDVTFRDGEVLSGTTLSYSPHAAGFFVTPLDGGNNLRIFVPSGAVRRVSSP